MTRQQQERAKIKGAFSAPAVTQAGKDSVKGSQAYLRQPGTCTLLCNSLNGASNIYEHSRICRQSWDGRVYHRPSLLSTASRGQLRHSYTATINKQTAARCYDCWLQSSQAVMESCSKSAEELELVSLLQDISDCWSPDGWLPVPQGSRSCRSQHMPPAQASYPSVCHTQQASRKQSSSSVEPSTPGHNQIQMLQADNQHQPLLAMQLNMNIAACDSSTHSTAEHAGDSMAAAHTHVVHLASQLIESSCKGDMSRPDAAPAPAAADAAHDNQEAAGADPQKAAAADGDDAPGDDKQEAAAVEADGAAVAAWLIQQPSLLQDVLGHLESLAMSAVDGSSIQTPASDPPALLGASSTARDEPSAACACATQLHFLLPDVSVIGMQAAGQPVPSSSASASRQECGQQAAATPLPSHADEHFVTPVVCVPQSEALSPHKTSADVAVQQSGTASLQVSHSNTGVCGGERQEAACARQQQHAACSDFHSDPGECQGSCHGASWPAPVPPTSRALLEHCTAGRYDEARKLLREYAEVDTSDAEGNTPLMLASKAGHGRLVKLLVRKGATLDALNAEGSTAEQLAMRCEHNGIASFLQGACKGSLLQSKRS